MTKLFYNLFNYLFEAILPLLKPISAKMRLFVEGRKQAKHFIEKWEKRNDHWLWFLCASLGEFEQALPLIKKFKEDPNNKIVLTFFSPSGYEQKKNHKLLDKVLYLPVDTPANSIKLINTIVPKAAFFIKYEFWENYFSALYDKGIPIYMISSAFRKNQIYFKWYGGFFKNTLNKVSHFFVQNTESEKVLNINGFKNVTVSGDTRFDRVSEQLIMNNELQFVEDFKQNRTCVVLGSTWPDGEAIFIEAINKSPDNVCYIIAPHEIKEEKIVDLKDKLKVATSVFSKEVSIDSKVLIIDAIGYLTKIYSYADIAYVGGAIGTTGLHNILEAAVFGVPIITGSNTDKFAEAQDLEKFGGLVKVSTKEGFMLQLNEITTNQTLREKMGKASKQFVQVNTGATQKVIDNLLTE